MNTALRNLCNFGVHRFRAPPFGPSRNNGTRATLPAAACRPGPGYVEKEFAHIPGSGRAAFGAQAAMQADILVLDHDAPGLQRVADIEVLLHIESGGH